MKYKESLELLIESLGGKENIKVYEHCATRLRIIVQNNDLVKASHAKEVPLVKGYFYSTGQHQFVYGAGRVNEAYEELTKIIPQEGNLSAKGEAFSQLSITQKVMRIFADILIPLIPALVTTGLLMGIRGFLVNMGVVMSPSFFKLFQVLTDTAFAFLPALIAYSASKKFSGNPVLGLVVGLMMVAPQLPTPSAVAMGDALPLTFNIFGFPLEVMGYQGSIIPAILAGFMVAKLEKFYRRFIPSMMDLVFTPFLAITTTILAILFILGPMTHFIESSLANSIIFFMSLPLGFGYMLVGATHQLLTVTGLQHSLAIVEIHFLESTGYNPLNAAFTASMAGQLGAGVALALSYQDKLKKNNGLVMASSTLFGITEPLLFGLTLTVFKVLLWGVIGGIAGGFYAWFLDIKASGMMVTFIPGLLLYTESLWAIFSYISLVAVSFGVAFLGVKLTLKKEIEKI